MNIYVILLSVFFLTASPFLAFFSDKIFKKAKNINPIYILLAGVFLAIFTMMCKIDFKPAVHNAYSTFFLALFHSMQALLLGYDFENLTETFTIADPYANATFIYMSFLLFLAPVYTFGFVLSFFESLSSYAHYFFKRGKDIFVLSDLTEKSAVLAESIRKKFPDSAIFFTNCKKDEKEETALLRKKAKKIQAHCFSKEFVDVKLRFRNEKIKSIFFAINEDETENTENSIKLIDRFKNRENTEIYVFATTKVSEHLLDSVESGKIKVRRINEDRTLAYSMVKDKTITDNVTVKNGKKIISTLIVGFGGYGTELAKSLLWCGQLPGYDLEINVIDSKKVQTEFKAECPEIMEHNNNDEIGEARYSLNFYDEVDVKTEKFNETVEKLTNTSVVYVSLGNDEFNIETSIKLRILFERKKLFPVIRTIVYSDVKANTIKSRNLLNHCGDDYKIELIGSLESRCSYDSIVNENLEKEALKYHLLWADSPEKVEKYTTQFNEHEYYRNSSIASAIHEKYRQVVFKDGKDIDVIVETPKGKKNHKLSSIYEHMRWNAYMRCEGFVFTGSPEEETRNDRAKMHHNLHPFNILSDDNIKKDMRIATKDYENKTE